MKDKYQITLLVLLVFVSIFSIYILRPKIAGDSLLYTSSIEVLETDIRPLDFIPMMIASTYLGLELLMFFKFFTGDIVTAWLLLDSLLYIIIGLSFYALLKRIFDSTQVAFLGTLFLVTNYAVLVFGLGHMMDIGGWAAYIAALYFSYRYLESQELKLKWLYLAAFIIGLGGLYKEYSFVAYFVTFGVLVFRDWKNWSEIFWKACKTSFLVFLPIVLLNVWTYFKFDYTYVDWFIYNQHAFDYQNRIVEFIKSFGVIYNFGWLLFIPGLFILLKRFKETFLDKNLFFIWLVVGSCSAVLLWPVVTRVLFITIPAVVLISCLFIKKINRHLYAVISILVLYVISNYLMDSFILDFVNLPF